MGGLKFQGNGDIADFVRGRLGAQLKMFYKNVTMKLAQQRQKPICLDGEYVEKWFSNDILNMQMNKRLYPISGL